MADLRGAERSGQVDEDFVDGLYLGDAIGFFLDARNLATVALHISVLPPVESTLT